MIINVPECTWLSTCGAGPTSHAHVTHGEVIALSEENDCGLAQVGLAAEYGFYYRMPDEEEWQTMVPDIDTSWRDIVRPILEVRRGLVVSPSLCCS